MNKLSIPDMSCGHCTATIEKTIKALDPAALLEFDMPCRTVTVQSSVEVDALRVALKAVGYEAVAA